MADLELTGPLNQGIIAMTELLSESDTFQAVTGAANATAALEFIKQFTHAYAGLPFGLIYMDDKYKSRSIASGAGQTFRGQHSVGMVLLFLIPAAQIAADETTVDARNAQVYMANKAGAIISEIKANASVVNGAYIGDVEADYPRISEEDDEDPIVGMVDIVWELG